MLLLRPSVTLDIREPYSALESLVYDRLLARALVPVQAAVFDRVLPHLTQGSRVLDVGCGGGHLLLALCDRRPDLHLHGVDLSQEQVGRGRRRARQAGARIEWTAASALALPMADATFDAVLSVASLKHWPDQGRGLSECIRVLRPGGLLFVVEVDRGCCLADARAFVRALGTPLVPLPVRLALFRTWVAGQGVDSREALALLGALQLRAADVEVLVGQPFLALRAEKLDAPSNSP
jgi:ubiquinone/menaquinone biosynthesis C-methylase UbiE